MRRRRSERTKHRRTGGGKMTSREGAQDHISEATRCIENVGDITEWGEGKEHSWRRFHFDPITPIEQAINATLEEKRTIAITKRGNGFDARLKDNPDRRGYGPTVMAAIGNLVFFHMRQFGIRIEMPNELYEQMKQGGGF